ncbi:uncharacterized protein UHOD_11447 [Ustilago sp. UG-2017b]|nr:uncharacterized protein UHOD_11447 [Ustilago sp. UG-2017b]
MVGVQPPWRPWTWRTRPYAWWSKHRHKEDRAQGAHRWFPLRGSRDKSQRNCHWSKEEEQCVRGLAPETRVGLSRYSVTIKLREDSGWRPLYILSDPRTAVDYCLRFYLSGPLTCYGSPSDIRVDEDPLDL